jgi:putative pre-16S rRNA nuclease
MGRVLSIDYGTKRVGIAVTDPLKIIANGLTTVHAMDALNFIISYCEKEEVECIVVGKPKRMNYEDPEVEKHIVGFVRKIGKALPEMKIERVDERFTSKIAQQAMITGGVKKKDRQKKEIVDEMSATIILQTYLEKP